MEKEVRNHFSIVVLNTLKSAWIFIGLLILEILPDMAEQPPKDIDIGSGSLITLIVFTFIFIVVFLFQFVRWRKTYILIKDDQLIVDKRYKIMKNKTTVRLSSISSVNLKQNILQRILNVYCLQLDINSAVTANKTDFNLVFNQETALKFKREIIELKNKLEPQEPQLIENQAGFSVNSEQVDVNNTGASGKIPILTFPVSKVIRHCLLSFLIPGVLISLLMFAGVLFSLLFPEAEETVSDMNLMISVLIALVPILIQCVSPFFRYYGFTVIKQNNRLIISYGLLTKQQYTLPLDKTSALIIRQTMLSRLSGLYFGEIINVGMGDEEKQQSPIFCLMVNKQELNAVIEHMAPAFVMSEEIQSSPTTAILPLMMKYLLLALPVFIATLVFGFWWVGCLWIGFIVLAAILSYKTKGLGLQGDKIAISSGVFAKKTIIISYSKIQDLSIISGPVSRRFGLCKGAVTILAATANKTNSIGYFPEGEFERLSQAIVEHESIEN
jgi:putative membrane protein